MPTGAPRRCGQAIVGRRDSESVAAVGGLDSTTSTFTTGGRFELIFSLLPPRVVRRRLICHTGFSVRDDLLASCRAPSASRPASCRANSFGTVDPEHVLVPARREMRRLAAVAARLERVVGADRDVDLLLVVAVHVAEPHVERAVGVDVEPFVDRARRPGRTSGGGSRAATRSAARATGSPRLRRKARRRERLC